MRLASVSCVMVLLLAGAARAQDAAPHRLFSLECRGEPLRVALGKLASATRKVVRVEPDVPDVSVRMTLKDVMPDHAVRLIVRQASRAEERIRYETTDQGFRVFLDPLPGPVPVGLQDSNRVTITVRKQPSPAPEPERTARPDASAAGAAPASSPGEGEATSAEAGAPTPGGVAGSPEAGAGQFPPRGDAPFFLIEPQAPYVFQRALMRPDYRSGYLLPGIVKTDKKPPRIVTMKDYYLKIEPISGTRLGPLGGGSPWSRRRSKPSKSTGEGPRSGGVGRRPF